ncbi:hypothetical protein Q8A73_010398 [Channa argus]|nr:hypothetical protein Q8A73_010398 [Channa argus]
MSVGHIIVSHEQKMVDRQQLNEAIGLLSNILNSPTAVTTMSEMLEQNRQISIGATSDVKAKEELEEEGPSKLGKTWRPLPQVQVSSLQLAFHPSHRLSSCMISP